MFVLLNSDNKVVTVSQASPTSGAIEGFTWIEVPHEYAKVNDIYDPVSKRLTPFMSRLDQLKHIRTSHFREIAKLEKDAGTPIDQSTFDSLIDSILAAETAEQVGAVSLPKKPYIFYEFREGVTYVVNSVMGAVITTTITDGTESIQCVYMQADTNLSLEQNVLRSIPWEFRKHAPGASRMNPTGKIPSSLVTNNDTT